MPAVHPDAELAPRDVVARAIHRQIAAGHTVFLDCRDAIGANIRAALSHRLCRLQVRRHRSGYAADPGGAGRALSHGRHRHATQCGRSSLPGLWVVGECASTGLHGANRLASNSLLEGLVFGARVADDVRGAAWRPAPAAARRPRRNALRPPPRRMCCATR